MGIYIRDMEMPKDCYECPCAHQEYNGTAEETQLGCFALDEWCYPEDETRLANCQLVELPDGHGRLIDADALITDVPLIYAGMVFGGQYVYTQTAIDNAPTVIPADPQKEEC